MPPFDFEALEAARAARGGPDLTLAVAVPIRETRPNPSFRRTDFAAGKLYDDGRFTPTHTNLTRDTAEALAGRLRDSASDDQVKLMIDEGWTYAFKMLGGNGAAKRRRGFQIPTRRK